MQNLEIQSNTAIASEETLAKYGPRIHGPLPGPKARAIVEADDRYISPSYTRSYPMVAKRGRGLRVEDVDGNEFLDFAAGIAVTSTGHCHPEVVAAIQKQAARTDPHVRHRLLLRALVTLAERLSADGAHARPAPVLLRQLRRRGRGVRPEAGALPHRPAKRHRVLRRISRAHHGRAVAYRLQAAAKRGFAPLVPGVTHVRYPYAYRGCSGGPQAEEAFALGCARYIEEKLFKTTLAPEEVAAIFVEPIQGEGGYVVAPTVFMKELRRICDAYGILLVADEVQSGAGRTGKWWAIEHSGVEPDIVCMAKGIASGMPLGVCMTRAEIMNWVPGSHASTFGGNPVCDRRRSGDHGHTRARGDPECGDDRRGDAVASPELAVEAFDRGRCKRARTHDRHRDRAATRKAATWPGPCGTGSSSSPSNAAC